MNNLQPMRQRFAVRFCVAPLVRLSMAIALLGCLLGFQILLVMRKLVGRGMPSVTAKKHAPRKQPMHLGNALEALKLAQALADEVGARPFLVSGTLLGIHRNGALLAHDNDLDLGIFADDAGLAAFITRLRAAPQVTDICEKRVGLLEKIANPWLPKLPDDVILYKVHVQCVAGARPVRLDLFVHFPACGYVAHGSTRTLWINSEFSLSALKLAGTRFWAPADRTRYLAENYGNFSVPKIEFESSVDCPNCVNLLSFPACGAMASKWAMFRQNVDEPRRALMGNRLGHYFAACFGGEPMSLLYGGYET